MEDSKILRQIDSKLTALLALTALAYVDNSKEVKLEVLLHQAGLEVGEIVKILNKKEPAVRKVLQRAK